MKELNFDPLKSGKNFRKNYKLHDKSEWYGKNLLTQWGINFRDFGDDNRYEKVWEKGMDKPDLIITYKDKSALLDWKGKQKSKWLVNKRAIDAYNFWSEKLELPVFVCFMVLGENNILIERRFAFLPKYNYIESKSKQWDMNKTVEFKDELPEFAKPNLLECVIKS